MLTWMFERDGERLILQRQDGPDLALLIICAADTRLVPFADMSTLQVFQTDMEAFLIRTGWTLVSFSPERRVRYSERRLFSRGDRDRRRPWTDGAPRSLIERIKEGQRPRRS